MWKNSLKCLCAALTVILAAAPAANAAEALETTAKIPFEFVVAGKTMPAGTYALSFSPSRALIELRGENGSHTLAILNHPAGVPDLQKKPQLVFRKSAGRHVLHQVILQPSPITPSVR